MFSEEGDGDHGVWGLRGWNDSGEGCCGEEMDMSGVVKGVVSAPSS